MFLGDPSILYFFSNDGVLILHMLHVPPSVIEYGMNSEDNTKAEHVISGFASSKFPSVIILAKLFFCFTFSLFGAIVHIFSF